MADPERQKEADFAANTPISLPLIRPDSHLGGLGGFAWSDEQGIEVGLVDAPDIEDKLRWLREHP